MEKTNSFEQKSELEQFEKQELLKILTSASSRLRDLIGWHKDIKTQEFVLKERESLRSQIRAEDTEKFDQLLVATEQTLEKLKEIYGDISSKLEDDLEELENRGYSDISAEIRQGIPALEKNKKAQVA